MSDFPLISIIIPTFNRRDFFVKALNSIYAQTYRNFEIIIIDDGSTDNTLVELKKYLREIKEVEQDGYPSQKIEKEKLKYFRFTMNQGIPRALNKGYDLAVGSYLCQLSSDDWFMPNKLQSQVNILNASENRRVGLIYSDYYFVDLDQPGNFFDYPNFPKRLCKTFYHKDKKILFDHLFGDCCMNACTFLMRKEFYKEIGPYSLRTEFEWNQDLWFNMKSCLSDWEIYKQEEPTAYITIHEGQASKQGKCGIGNNVLFPEMYELAKQKGWFKDE